MNLEQLEQCLRAGESTCEEFKRCGGAPGADAFETYCAFLNRDGGDLFLGVADDGTVLGVPENAVESVVRNLVKVMNDPNLLAPPFYVLPEVIEHPAGKIVHLRVPRSSDVHRFKGVCYDRVHEADVKVTATEQLAMMYIRKQNVYTEQKIFPFVTMAELRADLFPRARRMALARNPEHPWKDMTDDELLKSAGLFRRDYASGAAGICAAGILLFGKDDVIHDVFPAYLTDALLRRNDTDRYDDRLSVRTNLIESYSLLIQFGEKWLPDKFFLENGVSVSLRGKILREAVGNLLIHREYTSSYVARLVIEKGQLVADNANRSCHHGAITPQNLMPQAKNPLIADFFKEIGRADELGSGVRNLYKYVQLYSGRSPVALDEDVFTLTIPLNDAHAPEGPATGGGGAAPMGNGKTLAERIVEKISADGTLSRTALAAAIDGATPQKVKDALKKLQRDGIIRRVGPPHGGRWVIVKGQVTM